MNNKQNSIHPSHQQELLGSWKSVEIKPSEIEAGLGPGCSRSKDKKREDFQMVCT